MHITQYGTRLRRLSFFTLLGIAFATNAYAADRHTLWQVQGKHNTVYLLGSMHLLRANEPIPAVMDEAYHNAKKLVMEIDMDDLDPLAGQETTLRLGLLPSGETLAEQLDSATASKLSMVTKRLGIPDAMLSPLKPWLAAITLTQLQLMTLGFDAQSGIEQRLMTKAVADHKEIQGLETMEEQLGLLAGLSPKLQTKFLQQTLDETDQVESEIETMITAWRAGDTVALEKSLRNLQESPELYRVLIVERNRRWMPRLVSVLSESQDYLVIVGAMHLVGSDSVVSLLEQRGYKVVQH